MPRSEILRNYMHSYKKKKIKDVSHTLSSRQKHIGRLFLQGNGLAFLDNARAIHPSCGKLTSQGQKISKTKKGGAFSLVYLGGLNTLTSH